MADYSVTLAAEADTTPAFCREALYLVGFRFDAAFAGSSIGLLESQTEDGVYRTVQWDGGDWALTVEADKCCGFGVDQAEHAGPWLKVVSDVAQGAGAPSTIIPRYRDYGRG
jgi:hypothetical protein